MSDIVAPQVPDVDEARPTKRARIARDEEDSSSFLKEVSAVFKVGDVGPASVPFIRVLDAPNLSCTEAGYHHCWDNNIRNILQVLIPEGERRKRANKSGDPAVELVQNTVWAYDSAPYILGYYADKTIITFVALVHENGKTRCIGLSEINLKFITDRISNLQRLINMCSILPQLAKMVQKPSPEYATVEKYNSIISFVSAKLVKKIYTCSDGFPPRIDGLTRVQHLKTVYRLLKEADVPNTDSLVSAKDNVVFLEPIGLAVSPNTVGQLKECILCILDALVAVILTRFTTQKAHEIPLYHRDIRKDNVLRCIDDESKWFLIDWEDASTTPTYARPTFSRLTHSPAIREDGHGREVDIWGVGYLIKNDNGPIPTEIRDLGARICDDSLILTAHETRELVTAVFPASL
ncbi:hypothetical protein BDP27DRAFT_1404061 [Rhodocollybia butyracea]|uniref:Protein kinase domain-containing protein n=1 Tax=Rhodocollybia butyracea TaxID=206335 RepID=A0A9P5U4P5_9AGAR|nr:hypothetical protein BDP27DRAFT_1404061 [Rhodocollybia butyracea]